jgi:hypothetical protein
MTGLRSSEWNLPFSRNVQSIGISVSEIAVALAMAKVFAKASG